MLPAASRCSLAAALALAVSTLPTIVHAQAVYRFDLPAQPLADSLQAVGKKVGRNVAFRPETTDGRIAPQLVGNYAAEEALERLLDGTPLRVRASGQRSFLVEAPGETTAVGVGESDEFVRAPATELGSVVVTARRREERQIDVPIAMATVTGEDMDRFGMRNVADAINATAGASSSTSVQIRGISTSLGGNENGYYVNETPFTGVSTPWYPDVRSFDIDRVEVLKGPQGTLFGEGSMGGTVRIFTRKPEFNRFGFGVELDASKTSGGDDGQGAKAYVNVPLVDSMLALRVVATDENIAGWMDDRSSGRSDVNGSDVRTHRAALRFQPVQQWTLDAMYWKYKTATDASGSYLYDDLSYDAFSKSGTEWDSGSVTSVYEFGGSQLVYALARGEIEMGQFGELAPGDGFTFATSVKVNTHELRWASTGMRRLDWTVGAYLREASRADILDMPSYGIYSNSVQENDGYALFGEANLSLTPKWTLTAGLRYFHDEVDALEDAGDGSLARLDADFDSWNPRASLSYKPRENATIYASAARGFRSGQLQPISALQLADMFGITLPSQISPDSIWTYEVGGKAMYLEGRLLLEGAVYRSEWKDVAVRVPIQNLFNGLINSAGTVTRGVEAGATYAARSGLILQAGMSYVDSEYSETVPDTTFRRGMQAYNVPRFTASGQAGHHWDVGERLRGVASLTARHESPRKTPILEGGSAGDAITEISAKLGVESPSGWAAYLYARNLTNEDGAVSSRDPDLMDMDGSILDRGAATRLMPRTVGVVVRYEY